jgi:RNA polymerase sigma factor (TIGR02999 family)
VSPQPPDAESAAEVTRLLAELAAGDRSAVDRLFAALYDELRELARRQLGRRSESTLSTTAMVHEVYLKFTRASELAAGDRHHFFSLAARAMRQVLVDHVRRRTADRRPDPARGRPLDGLEIPVAAPLEELLAIETALVRLERADPGLGRLVELRVFGGLTLEEIAPLAAVSVSTLKRDWRKARAFLYRELAPGAPPTGAGPAP